MPMIDAKFTVAVDDTKKEELKSEFGRLIATLHKGEAYLMVGIQDGYDLWFGGKKLENQRSHPRLVLSSERHFLHHRQYGRTSPLPRDGCQAAKRHQ